MRTGGLSKRFRTQNIIKPTFWAIDLDTFIIPKLKVLNKVNDKIYKIINDLVFKYSINICLTKKRSLLGYNIDKDFFLNHNTVLTYNKKKEIYSALYRRGVTCFFTDNIPYDFKYFKLKVFLVQSHDLKRINRIALGGK